MSASTTIPPSPAPPTPHRPPASAPFTAGTQPLAWQGLQLLVPANWGLRKYEGTAEKGKLSVVDEDGLRLELLWETPKHPSDIEESVQRFLDSLQKQAKRGQRPFQAVEHPDILPRQPQRPNLTNFGWTGEPGDPMASMGWGAAWQCSHCQRVVVAHLLGRGGENSRQVCRLAREVLSTLCCHGTGGWVSWSVFGLGAELPEEFELETSKLLTGRLELRWRRPAPRLPILPAWTARDERLALQRVAPANVLLESQTLEEWTRINLTNRDKRRRFGEPHPASTPLHEALVFPARPRDWRHRALEWIGRTLLKRPQLCMELRVWHCPDANKIFVLESELRPANAHVRDEVLDSLECH